MARVFLRSTSCSVPRAASNSRTAARRLRSATAWGAGGGRGGAGAPPPGGAGRRGGGEPPHGDGFPLRVHAGPAVQALLEAEEDPRRGPLHAQEDVLERAVRRPPPPAP